MEKFIYEKKGCISEHVCNDLSEFLDNENTYSKSKEIKCKKINDNMISTKIYIIDKIHKYIIDQLKNLL